MMDGVGRGFREVDIEVSSAQPWRQRFPPNDSDEHPSCTSWRLELTDISPAQNLYFAAYGAEIHVFRPSFPAQILKKRLLKFKPPQTMQIARSTTCAIPHAINRLLVSELGYEEIITTAHDDGDFIACSVRSICQAIEAVLLGANEEQAIKKHLRCIHRSNVGRSAWGIATHKTGRLLAVSANSFKITVYAPALIAKQEVKGGPTRLQDREMILSGHDENIPSIAFCNTGADPHGKYLVSTDIFGSILIWDIWEMRGIKKIAMSFEGLSSMSPYLGWSVTCIEPRAFHQAHSAKELMGFIHPDDSDDDDNIQDGNIDTSLGRQFLRDHTLNWTCFHRSGHLGSNTADIEDTDDFEEDEGEEDEDDDEDDGEDDDDESEDDAELQSLNYLLREDDTMSDAALSQASSDEDEIPDLVDEDEMPGLVDEGDALNERHFFLYDTEPDSEDDSAVMGQAPNSLPQDQSSTQTHPATTRNSMPQQVSRHDLEDIFMRAVEDPDVDYDVVDFGPRVQGGRPFIPTLPISTVSTNPRTGSVSGNTAPRFERYDPSTGSSSSSQSPALDTRDIQDAAEGQIWDLVARLQSERLSRQLDPDGGPSLLSPPAPFSPHLTTRSSILQNPTNEDTLPEQLDDTPVTNISPAEPNHSLFARSPRSQATQAQDQSQSSRQHSRPSSNRTANSTSTQTYPPPTTSSPRARAQRTGYSAASTSAATSASTQTPKRTPPAKQAIPPVATTPDPEIPFSIFHTGAEVVTLLRPPFAKATAICVDPCHQHVPHQLASLNQIDRLALVRYIPDISVVAVGSQAGRVAIFTLAERRDAGKKRKRGDNNRMTAHKGKGLSPIAGPAEGNKHQQALRLDWVLPFHSQESRGDRPAAPLVGLAAAPIQGSEGNRGGGTRWRLLLTYHDSTVLAYEIWRGGKGSVDAEQMVF